MAGTGHGYEVLNPDEARAALAGVEAPNVEARAWLSSRAVLRFVTADAFTVRLDAARAASEAEARTEPGREREALLAKARAGGDLRLFVPQFLSALGPDFGHVMDWMRSLGRDAPRELAKVRKLGIPEAVAAADRWSAALRRSAARNPQPGTAAYFCDGRSGRVWFELLDGAALSDESVRMDHCVRGYRSQLGRASRIFSLRDADGKSHVTAELTLAWPREGAMGGRQLKAFGNKVPSPAYRGDAIDLLAFAGCEARSFGDATGMGIYPQGGRWRTLDEIGERGEVEGIAGYGIGDTFWFASPLNPTEFVAVGTGEEAWWRCGRPLVLRGTASRDLRHAELAALSAVRNASPGCAVSVAGIRVDPHGRAAPWTDVLPRTEVGGAAILTDGEASLVVRADEPTDVLVRIVEERGKPVAEGVRRRDWSPADLRRLAQALTVARVQHMAYGGDADLRVRGLDRAPDGTWHVWADAAENHPSGAPAPDGRPGQWETTWWRGSLRRRGMETLQYEADADGFVVALTGWNANPGDIDEAARFLNERGLAASSRYAAHFFSTLCWRTYGWGDSKGERAVANVGGRWHAMSTPDEVMAALKAAGKARFDDPLANEAAIRLLPSAGSCPAVDRELAKHLAAWAGRTTRDAIRDGGQGYRPIADSDRERCLRRHSEDRFEAAAALLPLMTKRERSRVISAAAAFLRDRMGRRKRPRDFTDPSGKAVGRVVAAFGADLPQAVIDRAVPYSFDICQKVTVTDPAGRVGIDPVMGRLFDSLARGAAKSRIAEAAGSDLFTLRDRKPSDFEEALSWMRLVTMACHSWRGTWAKDVTARVEEACAENGWPPIEGPAERRPNANWLPLAA